MLISLSRTKEGDESNKSSVLFTVHRRLSEVAWDSLGIDGAIPEVYELSKQYTASVLRQEALARYADRMLPAVPASART